jgi:osmotically-inducible protein OsmY
MKTRISIALLSVFLVQATGLTAYGQPHRPPSKSAFPVTDDTITDQIRLKLAGDPVIKGGALNVEVRAGVVTLSGAVAKDKQRARADKVARRVKGVKQVINRIEIKKPSGQ